jgi:hypothetical protein
MFLSNHESTFIHSSLFIATCSCIFFILFFVDERESWHNTWKQFCILLFFIYFILEVVNEKYFTANCFVSRMGILFSNASFFWINCSQTCVFFRHWRHSKNKHITIALSQIVPLLLPNLYFFLSFRSFLWLPHRTSKFSDLQLQFTI